MVKNLQVAKSLSLFMAISTLCIALIILPSLWLTFCCEWKNLTVKIINKPECDGLDGTDLIKCSPIQVSVCEEYNQFKNYTHSLNKNHKCKKSFTIPKGIISKNTYTTNDTINLVYDSNRKNNIDYMILGNLPIIMKNANSILSVLLLILIISWTMVYYTYNM